MRAKRVDVGIGVSPGVGIGLGLIPVLGDVGMGDAPFGRLGFPVGIGVALPEVAGSVRCLVQPQRRFKLNFGLIGPRATIDFSLEVSTDGRNAIAVP